MATKQVAQGTFYLWRSKPDWWKRQRYMIVTTRSVPGVKQTTTIEEYHKLLDSIAEEARSNGVDVQEVTMNPEWVSKEMNLSQLPLTSASIALILDDPIGIERKGFKSK